MQNEYLVEIIIAYLNAWEIKLEWTDNCQQNGTNMTFMYYKCDITWDVDDS